MALTESKMLALGTQAPDFVLPDTVSGNTRGLQELRGERATLVMFICNHCPYVIHVNPELVRLRADYAKRGVSFVAISSNNVDKYPDDSPEKMKLVAEKEGYGFPYLYDESQDVAKAYNAACTPDFYLFDADLLLRYRGRLDGSRPGNNAPLDGSDLRMAIDAVLEGQPLSEKQYPSAGCGIKWK